MSGLFLPHVLVGHAPQFIVDEWRELLKRGLVAFTPFPQKCCYLVLSVWH
jgi:hypothetical protein